jgi:hypothetical protein
VDCIAFAEGWGDMIGKGGGRAGGTARTSGNNQTSDESVTQNGDRKWRRILCLLAGGAALTRFDAERHGDHALNSTISTIGRMGITVSRKPITIEGRFGKIHCKRYWLEPGDRDTAIAILQVRT